MPKEVDEIFEKMRSDVSGVANGVVSAGIDAITLPLKLPGLAMDAIQSSPIGQLPPPPGLPPDLQQKLGMQKSKGVGQRDPLYVNDNTGQGDIEPVGVE